MSRFCTFILCGYHAPSGWFTTWETNGKMEKVLSPFRYAEEAAPCEWYARVEVEPGQYLFLHRNEVEHEESETEELRLIRVPVDEEEFRQFKEKAEAVAGEAVYNRIIGYKSSRSKLPELPDFTNDFIGEFLEEYTIHSWDGTEEDSPSNLNDALLLTYF